MAEIPVWTIVLALVGLLVNLVIGVIAWAINQKLSDLGRTIERLSDADAQLGADMRSLAKDLADHKLHVANTYARSTDIAAIFRKIDALRGELITEIKELIEKVNDRIDYHHPPSKG